jgi:hypothetical protein
MDSTLWGGITVIVIGVLLLLGKMGVIPPYWFSFWGTIFMVVGLVQLFQSTGWGGKLWGVLLLATGLALQIQRLGIIDLQLQKSWPLFIIGAGLVILAQALDRTGGLANYSSPDLNLFCFMGGGEYRIQTKSFRGGSATAFLGGFEIDLRDAEMEGTSITIALTAFLGGGVLRVPESWNVQMRGSSIMGGNSLKTRQNGQGSKLLLVEGLALLGGFEVKN